MIVVTTPTGQIGRQVLGTIADSTETIRVITRDPARLSPRVRERTEVMQGSDDDIDVVTGAFTGADCVFWLVPPNPRAGNAEDYYRDFTRPACEAINSQGVRRVGRGLEPGLRIRGERRAPVGGAGHGRADQEHRRELPGAGHAVFHGEPALPGRGHPGPGHVLPGQCRRPPAGDRRRGRDIAAVAASAAARRLVERAEECSSGRPYWPDPRRHGGRHIRSAGPGGGLPAGPRRGAQGRRCCGTR